jgi:hypothetical protein
LIGRARLAGSQHASFESFLCEVGEEAFDGIDVGVKWKTKQGCLAIQSSTLGCLWAESLSTMIWTVFFFGVDHIAPDGDGASCIGQRPFLKDIEGREQGSDTMALVIVGHGAGAAVLHRHRLGAVRA